MTNFPSELDSLTNPVATDNTIVVDHASQHANINDAMEAVQAKVGKDNSDVPTSLDYRLRMLEDNPFHFPFAGNEQSYPNGYTYDRNSGTEHTLLYVPSGAGNKGVVRILHIIFDSVGQTMTTDINKLIFNIKVDGESSPSTSVPLASLICHETPSELTKEVVLDTAVAPLTAYERRQIVETPFWGITNPIPVEEPDEFACYLAYEMPYSDGIYIYITTTDPELTPEFWTNTYFQDDLLDSWNKNLRFMAERSNETNVAPANGAGTVTVSGKVATFSSAVCTVADIGKYLVSGIFDALIIACPDANHYTLGIKDDASFGPANYKIETPHLFINRPAGEEGYIASVNGSFEVWNLELDPVITAGQNPQLDDIDLTGGEDFFFCAFYALKSKPLGSIGGVLGKGTKWCGYRNFLLTPKHYTDGCQGKICNVGGTLHHNWTVALYKKIT